MVNTLKNHNRYIGTTKKNIKSCIAEIELNIFLEFTRLCFIFCGSTFNFWYCITLLK